MFYDALNTDIAWHPKGFLMQEYIWLYMTTQFFPYFGAYVITAIFLRRDCRLLTGSNSTSFADTSLALLLLACSPCARRAAAASARRELRAALARIIAKCD